MDSLTRQPVTMTSTNSQVSQPAPIIAPTLPVTPKVQFADSLINSKPASVPTIPSTSTVTSTTTEPAVANTIVNSALKSTSNLTSTVNPQPSPAVNFSLNSSANSPQTSTATARTPSPNSTLVNNPPSVSAVANPPTSSVVSNPPPISAPPISAFNNSPPISAVVNSPPVSAVTNPPPSSAAFNPPPISAVTNPPQVSAPVNSSQITSAGNNNSTTTLTNTITNPPTQPVISTAAPTTTTTTTNINVKPTPNITSAAPTTIAASPVPEKSEIVNKIEPDIKEMNSASSKGSGKSGSISSNSSVPKETRTATDSSNMNGSMDKGNNQSQDRAAKKYVPPDTVGKDVQEFCEKIEKAGLCAPANTVNSFPGNIASVLSTPPAARPNTAESVVENSSTPYKTSPSPGKQATAAKAGIGGGTSTGSAKASATTATTREPRPSTATPKASSGSGVPKTGSGSTPVATRNSTARAASAKVSPTSPTSKNISNGKSSTPAAATNGNGHHDDKSRAKSAPKLRPTSSLYRPTASSALKGIANITPPKSSKSLSGPNNNIKSNKPDKMGDAAGNGGSGESKSATLKEQFAVFSRFGDTSSDGKHITLTNCDKWMKQAHVIDGKKITTTDTSISFKKLFKTAKKVGFEDFKKYVDDLAASKKMEPTEITDKLVNCGAPGLSSATRASGGGVYERLTDTSRYTGSHKERFDSTGKGRGIEGRREVQDNSGYTASFKSKLADGSSPAK